jgi:hypothetical protein
MSSAFFRWGNLHKTLPQGSSILTQRYRYEPELLNARGERDGPELVDQGTWLAISVPKKPSRGSPQVIEPALSELATFRNHVIVMLALNGRAHPEINFATPVG